MAYIAYIPAVAILFGIINTVLIHIAKSMERQGIEIFDQLRAAMKKERIEGPTKEKLKKPTIYIVGLVLNNLSSLWALLAGLFGPPSMYTSMFGIGLIALLIYSRKVLKEETHRIEICGAISIIAGTLIIGLESINRPFMNMASVSILNAFLAVFIFFIAGAVVIVFSLKWHKSIIGFAFGLVAGGCGGLDPFFKGLLSAEAQGLVALAFSFVLGTIAFLITQWGFARKARANVLVPAYNSTYVVLPVIFQVLLLPGFELYPTTVAGLALVIAGIVLMKAFKPDTGHGAHEKKEE
nr:hypothetical protein [Candidatus Sigynarchaeota archaeon]